MNAPEHDDGERRARIAGEVAALMAIGQAWPPEQRAVLDNLKDSIEAPHLEAPVRPAWNQDPAAPMAPAEAILGQPDAGPLDHYRGEYWPSARCFNMPYGVAVHRERLFVADTANSRLPRFDGAAGRSFVDGAQALAGQAGFADKGDNPWLPAARDSMCWPCAVGFAGDAAVVVDSGNNRVLLWDVARWTPAAAP